MTTTLKTRTLSAAIANRLRQDILAGVHPSETPLKQDMLATSFGVSRIPVREALFQLEAEGLVRIEPHKGALVTGLSLAEVDDVFALRLLLEPRLLRDSLPRLDQDDLARLDAMQAAFAIAIRNNDSGRWGTLNAQLHLAMYARANQPRTLSIVTGLLQTSERYTRIQLATRQAWQRAQKEHGELITLCRASDIDGATALLEQHIGAVQSDLIRLIGKRPLPGARRTQPHTP